MHLTTWSSSLVCIVAGVYFDPDVYIVNEGGTVTLILRTNVTVNKRFSVLVNTRDDSASSKYCITLHCDMQFILDWANQFLLQLPLVYVHAIHLFHSNVVHQLLHNLGMPFA